MVLDDSLSLTETSGPPPQGDLLEAQAGMGNINLPGDHAVSRPIDRNEFYIPQPHPIGEGEVASQETQLLGWPSIVPVPMQSISRTPTPPSNEDDKGPYFRGKFAPRTLRQDQDETHRVNPAELIALKQAAYALAHPVVRFQPITPVKKVTATVCTLSPPRARARRPSQSRGGKTKRRHHSQGDAFDDPITIDVSPRGPSTSRLIHGPSSQQAPRGTRNLRRDHITKVHPNVKFPNLDFIDRPGLTAAQRPPFPVDPASAPWPNSIVIFTFILSEAYSSNFFPQTFDAPTSSDTLNLQSPAHPVCLVPPPR